MARTYACTNCDREVGRENLRVKRTSFREMGEGGATVRSRVEAWLCTVPNEEGALSCLEADPVWSDRSRGGGFTPAVQDVETDHATNHVLDSLS